MLTPTLGCTPAALALLWALGLFHGNLAAAEGPPNFVLIFADDLGYGDLGVFGSPNIRTPNIDRLAFEGVKLTDFYSVSPVCTPSRAGLLTGRYPVRSGMVRVLFPREEFGLPDSEITLAEVLKEKGYATALVGKWHLGDRPEHSPTRHGFDYRYGIPFSNDMTRPHSSWPEPLRIYEQDEVVIEGVDQSQITKLYTDKAISFIEKNKDGPFFLYLPHSMPHWPWYSSEKFDGGSIQGPYGDTVEEIDWSTGEILKALKRNGLDDNTLVIFTSDNGGSSSRRAGIRSASRTSGNNGTLRGRKGQTWEGGMRVPFIARLPGRIPAATVRSGISCAIDLFTTLIELAGARIPDDRPIDGVNLWPMLSGEGPSPRDHLYYFSHNWESRPQLAALRVGRWKLHFKLHWDWPQTKFEPTELYDLNGDPSESMDQFADYADIVAELARRARTFHAAVEYGEMPGVHYPPGAPERPFGGKRPVK